MSYPPPPGLNNAKNPNLPARPPPSTLNPVPSFSKNGPPKPAFAAFAPRAVLSSAQAGTANPVNYPAQPTYSSTPTYGPSTPGGNQQMYDQYNQYSAPQIRNPFVPTPTSSQPPPHGQPIGYGPDDEADIARWQSAYTSEKPVIGQTSKPVATASTAPTSRTDTPNIAEKQQTVKRAGGGTEWTDSTLLEWDPAHFRLFVGNLAGEVTDESLLKAFVKYTSVQKARVIRDKRTTKSKGFGFVSFSDGDDYFKAAKEMNGKYIGSHPITITKARTEVRPTTVKDRHTSKNKRNKNKHENVLGQVDYSGVGKKQPKTKGGLKLLG